MSPINKKPWLGFFPSTAFMTISTLRGFKILNQLNIIFVKYMIMPYFFDFLATKTQARFAIITLVPELDNPF